ncbi:hypothetical protein C1752_01992 [Acaryochloris thomasi RCC1774]|uniref:Porin n=2 Tax=Acaryochloris TaxID=155977 RepID=A0A2W1JPX1_9CYAN|nr:hypothetical protein C1752_01992 [Acaryochloris thomasi RCC1774]
MPSPIAAAQPSVTTPEDETSGLEGQVITPVWQLVPEAKEVAPRQVPVDSPNEPETVEFQPTTQLSGEAVFAFVYAAGDRPGSASIRPSLGRRIRLDVETSFSGEDQLRFRFQNTNVAELDDVFGTDMARLSIQGDDKNEIALSRLDYTFPIGDRTEVFLPVVGGSISDIADPLNPLFSGSGSGSVSRFGQRNPLYRQGGGAGVGLTHEVTDHLELSLGYLSDAENLLPEEEYVAFAQATYEPTDTLSLGLLYAYGFNGLDTGTGSEQSNDPFMDQSDAISSHSVGIQATADVTPQFTLSGWAGLTRATATDLSNSPEADILNWAVTLGYSDLLGDSNVGGIVIGYPPQVISVQGPATHSLHLELFYKIHMNEQISVTPGIVVITNPEADPNRSPIVLGAIRTTFEF